MSGTRCSPRAVALAWKRRKIYGAGGAAIIAAILAPGAIAQTVSQQPPTTAFFAVYPDAQGSVTTNSTDPSTLNTKNPYFDPSIGKNGQACVTCHEPFTGITITVPNINQAFNASHGTDPLFRFNDTANNPSFGSPTAANYSVFLSHGTARTAKTVPATKDFTVVADAATNMEFAAGDTPTNNMFPLMNDPQHPGTPTLSLFRRPLINTNVNFDSAVLWDGRADISMLDTTPGGQVMGAIQTMLLGAGDNQKVNTAIADFMTGVYTDQKSSNVAGELTAVNATGGVGNLVALSQSPSRPCVFDPAGVLTPFVEAVATPTSCTKVMAGPNNGTFNLFSSWLDLPNTPANIGRKSVARGEIVFNTASAARAGGFGCATCHSVNNLGNNALAVGAGFRRDGTESPSIMNTVLAAAQATGTQTEIQRVQDMIDRNNQLPLYDLRPSTRIPACPTAGVATITTDPGRALVTGCLADVGLFKPPILRNLAVRAPFFHAGVAADSPAGSAMEHLVTFYNFRFNLQMTADEQADLVNFLNAL
jgi:cytochrome c peroxidase